MKPLFIAAVLARLLASCVTDSAQTITNSSNATPNIESPAQVDQTMLQQLLTQAEQARKNWRYQQSLELYPQAALAKQRIGQAGTMKRENKPR